MNLLKLRKMTIDGDLSVQALRYLLECRGECEYLDYKEELNLNSDYNKSCFARDVLAMKNVGGGYIVLGVKDQTWEPIGINQSINVDTKLFRDLLRKVTGLELEVDIVTHKIYIHSKEREFAIILIRSSAKPSKRRFPLACKVSFNPKEVWGLRDGDIYFRKGDQTVRIHANELEELLTDLYDSENKSALEQQLTEPSPFMIEEGLYRILPPDYENFIDRPLLQKDIQRLIETEDRRIWIINVYGPGGVGKSALISWLAYHC